MLIKYKSFGMHPLENLSLVFSVLIFVKILSHLLFSSVHVDMISFCVFFVCAFWCSHVFSPWLKTILTNNFRFPSERIELLPLPQKDFITTILSGFFCN